MLDSYEFGPGSLDLGTQTSQLLTSATAVGRSRLGDRLAPILPVDTWRPLEQVGGERLRGIAQIVDERHRHRLFVDRIKRRNRRVNSDDGVGQTAHQALGDHDLVLDRGCYEHFVQQRLDPVEDVVVLSVDDVPMLVGPSRQMRAYASDACAEVCDGYLLGVVAHGLPRFGFASLWRSGLEIEPNASGRILL